jgi:uncharacterized protein YdiU (UPF0061 family)
MDPALVAAAAPAFARFDNSYARELGVLGVRWPPAAVPAPRGVYLNHALADELGLHLPADADEAAALLAGNRVPAGAEPFAQAYAGHQFGGFSPQLGDGRALLLGEVIDRAGRRRDLAFKGSGRTPYSRGGDGKAALGPMLREVLIGESLHALGVPTTRALAVVASGETVWREQPLPGAVLTRVAASHLRVGTFEFVAAHGDRALLQRLLAYTLARHDPELVGAPDAALGLLHAVVRRQAALVAQWMNLGFIHGVMNTDNMTISGEAIDFGPCAMLEAYHPATVFSSIDRGGRYAYGNQPAAARWNLARLAEALLPLIVEGEDATAQRRALEAASAAVAAFDDHYRAALLRGQRAKLGLGDDAGDAATDAADAALAADWLALLQRHRIDHTLGWRYLADAAAGDEAPLAALFAQAGAEGADAAAPSAWLQRWHARCAAADGSAPTPASRAARAQRLRRVNPLVIARNHCVEQALQAATQDADLHPFDALLAALRHPYDPPPPGSGYDRPAPAEFTAAYCTYCGT